MEKIYFYAPNKKTHSFFAGQIPQWNDIKEIRKFQSGNFTSWIFTTYCRIKNAGFPCEIIDYLPEKGIVIADRDTLGNIYPYLEKLMLICAKGDREYHPSAHLHIVHNMNDQKKIINSIWNPYYISHWPQPSIIPRKRDRNSLVENIAFIGSRSNICQELLSDKWIKSLEELDCKWYPMFDKNQWHDYSNIDAIVAVRSFDKLHYLHKPASKLINCWQAHVPAILTPESAFLAAKKSDLDFLVVNSIDETIEAVKKLKNNPQLYLAMVQNGQARYKEFSEDKITKDWINFFEKFAIPHYQEWLSMSEIERRTIFSKRYLRLKFERIKQRLKFN
ncbi:hypothetical protein Cyast_2876 [Cyanobacterium stanieri PCC 7202]|uniref:Glycosyl transferase family 1 domain-containing protein n=1 Tax=Cyanobacterium stanieri (strain ATCC 29140 / PCC 7202) TaxID=292563 RepID=K9YPL8_CYASC|nr:hypothetical protein Cyast_2876 [Cyanobacterium stanieri PCC 7202]